MYRLQFCIYRKKGKQIYVLCPFTILWYRYQSLVQVTSDLKLRDQGSLEESGIQ